MVLFSKFCRIRALQSANTLRSFLWLCVGSFHCTRGFANNTSSPPPSNLTNLGPGRLCSPSSLLSKLLTFFRQGCLPAISPPAGAISTSQTLTSAGSPQRRGASINKLILAVIVANGWRNNLCFGPLPHFPPAAAAASAFPPTGGAS